MIAGIVGLGLMGGSFAKAYNEAGHTVLAANRTESVLKFAELSGDVAGELTDDRLGECDVILLCTYPEAVVGFLTAKASKIGTKPVVIDCCGTKRQVTREGFRLAEQYGFTYVGGHPMAGTQYSGYKYARGNMFKGAPMVIVPERFDDIELFARIKRLLLPAGFGRISITTAEEHDRIIAFTSQLAHVVSSAYIKSPTASAHKGFSAGSYKDMTRVAWLNPEMWTELFLENSDYLLEEIDNMIRSLGEYRDALASGDRETLLRLLEEGKQRKEEVDG
ncbi:MAG: prephenate dehydrogenase [Clostridia bacterium]|nr:prephenate dehydrogenase [Clostridia bacterium]